VPVVDLPLLLVGQHRGVSGASWPHLKPKFETRTSPLYGFKFRGLKPGAFQAVRLNCAFDLWQQPGSPAAPCLIRVADLRKLPRRLRLLVFVRVVLQRQLPVRALDLVLRRAARQAQRLVVVGSGREGGGGGGVCVFQVVSEKRWSKKSKRC
jgi:hypothetical protein